MSEDTKRRRGRPPKSAKVKAKPSPPGAGASASAEARRVAIVVLEVLAGSVGPTEAAELIGITPNSYYKLEARALDGLIEGCEPRPRGRIKSPESELSDARQATARLERECASLKALVRALGRTAGVKSPRKKSAKAIEAEGKQRGKPSRKRQRKRKPVIRALRHATELKQNLEQVGAGGASPEEGSHDGSHQS